MRATLENMIPGRIVTVTKRPCMWNSHYHTSAGLVPCNEAFKYPFTGIIGDKIGCTSSRGACSIGDIGFDFYACDLEVEFPDIISEYSIF